MRKLPRKVEKTKVKEGEDGDNEVEEESEKWRIIPPKPLFELTPVCAIPYGPGFIPMNMMCLVVLQYFFTKHEWGSNA